MDMEDGALSEVAASAPAAPRTTAALSEHPRAQDRDRRPAQLCTHSPFVALIVDRYLGAQDWRPRELRLRPEGVRISPGAMARGRRTGAVPDPPAAGSSQTHQFKKPLFILMRVHQKH